MSWLYLVILSNFLFAVVFAIDKILVKKAFSPLVYTLIVGGFEGLALILIPFVNFTLPEKMIILAALLSGAFFVFSIYFYFKALEKYEASWVAPLLFGVFVPIFTFILSEFLLDETLTFFQVAALAFIIFGGIVISFSRDYKFSVILLLLVSGLFIALDFVFLKIVFNNANFWTGYILSRAGGFLTGAALFFYFEVLPKGSLYSQILENLRIKNFREIFKKEKIIKKFEFAGGFLIVNKILGFFANLILIYALSLSSPALVNGLAGARYAFLLVLAGLLSLKWPKIMAESFSFKSIIIKTIAVLFIAFGIIVLLFHPAKLPGAKIWGVTYSSLYSQQLGFDAEEVLLQLLDDLKVREFRLIAYWPDIEKIEGQYDFSDIDFQINEVSKRGGKIILAIGKRLPRWPECHEPSWTKQFTINDQQQLLLKHVETIINRYKNNPAIWAWQVENEPFLWGFGECPRTDDEFLDKEIALVKSLDTPPGGRPVILTDSGELGRWHRAYKRADIFGTTIYRVVFFSVYPGKYFKYPLTPNFFNIKTAIMETIFGKKMIVNIELQAEPWLKHRPPVVPLEEQFQAFSLEQFRENVEYARQVGYEKNYLWGVEWMYWLKEKQNHPEFWEEARKLYN